MNQRSKLNSQEKNQEQEMTPTHQTQQPGGLEFATPEDMLRHDTLQTAVPPNVAFRLRDSIGGTPSTRTSWWKRLLGGSGQ